MSEGHTASEGEDNEEVEDYSNDPLDTQELDSPKTGKKARGRPKKGMEKKTFPTKNYNTRQRVTSSDAVNAATSTTSTKFVIDDETLRESGMQTTFKSGAEQCDSENTTTPMHGDLQVDK